MDYETYLAARVKQVFSNLEEVEERLDAEPEAFLASTFRPEEAASLEGLYEPQLEFEGIAPPTARPELYEPGLSPLDQLDLGLRVREQPMPLLPAARSGLTKIRTAGEARPDLTEDEIHGLEAIVLLEGRPSILIENGHFAPPPAEWAILESHRATIENVIPSVGRIEVPGHPRVEWVGTGFLVGPTVIMTNRHVATEFSVKRRGAGWKFAPGIKPRIDFREEHKTPEAVEFDCVEVVWIHPRLDLALLRVEPSSGSGKAMPEPLTVHYRTPKDTRERKIYVLGYPAWDGRRNEPEVMSSIFAGIYGVKRLQPGTIRTRLVLGPTFKHDASTLGGNSGSCIVDLESGKVLGLHFAGKYRRYNTAIALWKLRRSKNLERAGVQFA
jgi:S1-C subfamily serine protease